MLPGGAYWVVPGRLLAGPYPGRMLEAVRQAGVTSFVDLTEPDEGLPPYADDVAPTTHVRMAIRDFACPSVDEMTAILDRIDSELARGETVYVHCYGGRGRTGTVVGCWLVRHGASGDAALARIAELRRGFAGASPETDAQRKFVAAWRAEPAASAP